MQTPLICSSVLRIGSYLWSVISVFTAFLFKICHYFEKHNQPFLHLFNHPANIKLIAEITQTVSCNSFTTLPLYGGSDIFWISFLPCLCNRPTITLKFLVRILHINSFNSVTLNFGADRKCIAFYFHGDISSCCMTVQMSSLKCWNV